MVRNKPKQVARYASLAFLLGTCFDCKDIGDLFFWNVGAVSYLQSTATQKIILLSQFLAFIFYLPIIDSGSYVILDCREMMLVVKSGNNLSP
jgi:hypothetical protein